MLVAIEPPVIGQTYGLGSEDIYHLLLATRWEGQTLWPISHWPTHVYVLRPLDKSVINQPEIDKGFFSLRRTDAAGAEGPSGCKLMKPLGELNRSDSSGRQPV
jgi:hypothetical protein